MRSNLSKMSLSLFVLSFAMCAIPSTAQASLINEYDEADDGAATDNYNHRMENAFEVLNTDFTGAAAGDYVDIKGHGRVGDAFRDFGDSFRAYLYEGVTYRGFTNPLDRFGGSSTPPADVIHNTTLTVVDGGSVEANDPGFDFGANGYQFVGANDDGGLTNQFTLSSSLEFTASRTGYHYFFVTEWDGDDATHPSGDGQSSVSFDAGLGYSSGDAGGLFGGVTGGMYATASGGLTPTGSVFGDLEDNYYYWLRIEQLSGGGANPVPEPSSIAIFSALGLGGLFLRFRRRRKALER